MDFEANRLDLLSMARKASKVARNQHPVEVLRGVLIESSALSNEVTFIATDFEAALVQKEVATVKTEGSMIINAALLTDILEHLLGETVMFSTQNRGFLKIWAGTSIFNICSLPGNHYPKPVMPFPDESVKLTGICSLAKKTVFVTSHDDAKPTLKGVMLKIQQNSAIASASDGSNMMMVKSKAESSDALEILLPASAFQMLASISKDEDEFEVGVIGKEVVFTKSKQLFSMKTLTGTFMDMNKIIQSVVPAYTAVVQMDDMRATLGRVSIASDYVNMVILDNAVRFSSQGEVSVGREEINASAAKATPKTGFNYKVTHLLKLSQMISGPVKLIMNSTGFMLIRNNTEIFFSSPVRKPPIKLKPKSEQANEEKAADTKKAVA